MLLGRVQVAGGHLAETEIVVDGVVLGVEVVQLRKNFPRPGDLSFGICRGAEKEKVVLRLCLQREGKTEQEKGQICEKLAHTGHKNMYFL